MESHKTEIRKTALVLANIDEAKVITPNEVRRGLKRLGLSPHNRTILKELMCMVEEGIFTVKCSDKNKLHVRRYFELCGSDVKCATVLI